VRGIGQLELPNPDHDHEWAQHHDAPRNFIPVSLEHQSESERKKAVWRQVLQGGSLS
jgi:hypothetical protein